jgi:hypothetical protein
MIWELPMHSVSPPGVTEFAVYTLQNLRDAHDSIIEAHVFQTHYANRHHSEDPPLDVGDLVYLSSKNLSIPAGWARKLVPKFIGPFRVLKANAGTSTYTLDLSDELKKHKVHLTFHVSLLRPHLASTNSLFPNWEGFDDVALNAPPETEWFVDEITSHFWDDSGHLWFHVLWSLGDETDEPLENVRRLRHLDQYLKLMGVSSP